MSNYIPEIVVIYGIISSVCVAGLVVQWIEPDLNSRKPPIWPIAGVLWPVLAVIAVWKVWKDASK